MQNQNSDSRNFRLLTNNQADNWYLTAEVNTNKTGKLVILDNTGNLVSRQIVQLVKGENNIPVPRDNFSNAQIHVLILYLGNEVVFSQLILDKLFLHK